MRVVLAVDKFKGSMPASAVARHLATGMTRERSGLDVVELPIADGGDGTVDAAVAAGYRRVPVTTTGPTGAVVSASYAMLGARAVVELASTCGLQLLPAGGSAPMTASSRGVGEAIRAAVEAGAREVVVGLGGSASTDGGAGMLQALGAALHDEDGGDIAPGGAGLAAIARIDLSGVHDLLRDVRLIVASDVSNPLLGDDGAAAIYAPQKGADPEQVRVLELALTRFSNVLAATAGIGEIASQAVTFAGAGAAGGCGYAALLIGAAFRPGIDVVLELCDLATVLDGADLVVTGEGSVDRQSLNGKAPIGVARAAATAHVPVVVVGGRIELDHETLAEHGIQAAYAVIDLAPDAETSMRDPGPYLERIGAAIIHDRRTS
ncbi:glycerate kinase [Rudaeicoccus suwonensis]|uniref:Glycerate kinase n=1 Tax=Rudaeicoccus suwonensis TaxID=657409 RepID=A0A561E9W8_9MICO|nr:glycerate kinase [Rudaeicoccus suwonensis]TWE12408.1 glycerate kinase [Rudaeicoccus suwonensis]